MKTKLTIRVLREGKKYLLDANHCIGATLLRKALKEQGSDTGTGLEIWVSWASSMGNSRNKLGDIISHKSFIDGKEVNLMRFGNYTTWQRVKLFFFPVIVEFRKVQ